MQRIKITRNYKSYKAGDVLVLDNNVAFGLIDSGIAVITKDIVPDDYKQAGDKNGKFTKLRSNKFK